MTKFNVSQNFKTTLSMKGIFVIFLFSFTNFYYCQKLNDDIKFKNLSKDDSLKIENIKNLLPKSRIISKAEGNRYALKRFGCIEDYKILYLYENQPILFDEKEFNIIEEMRNDSTEKTTIYISKKRTGQINFLGTMQKVSRF